LETFFQVAFIPEEEVQGESSSVLKDVQKWVVEFSQDQIYDESYSQLMKKTKHQFNDQINPFFIREGNE
jgi:hypothetical protein